MAKAIVGKKQSVVTTLRSLRVSPRTVLENIFGTTHGGNRDLRQTYGYRVEISHEDCMMRYKRSGIVSRIVNAYPDAIWSRPPDILNNQMLSDAINDLDKAVSIYSNLNRVERLSGLGKFAVLLLGFDDVKNPSDMLKPVQRAKLLYLQPYSFGAVKVEAWEMDPSKSEIGMPSIYALSITPGDELGINAKLSGRDISAGAGSVGGIGGVADGGMPVLRVHRSRILHVLDGKLESNVIGNPIIERVYDYLDDLDKVVGGSAETYWLNSRRGMQLDLDKDVQVNEGDMAALDDEVADYQNNLTRVLRTRGVNLKELGGASTNPGGTFNVVMSMISVTTGIPQRIFIGSEQGKLASEQDRQNWSVRINERRQLSAEPDIVRPFIKRLQSVGALPEGTYNMEWPEGFQMSPLERAGTAMQQSTAAMNIAAAQSINPELASNDEARSIIYVRGELRGESRVEKQTNSDSIDG